jgi:hypothetical protein
MAVNPQINLFEYKEHDKKSTTVVETDNLAEKKRLALKLLEKIDSNIKTMENLLNRQYVRK